MNKIFVYMINIEVEFFLFYFIFVIEYMYVIYRERLSVFGYNIYCILK